MMRPASIGILMALLIFTPAQAEVPVGRYQVISVPGVVSAILLDTATGCAWHLAALPRAAEHGEQFWFVFLPRESLPPGTDKMQAMIPRECASFDGVIPERYLRGLLPR